MNNFLENKSVYGNSRMERREVNLSVGGVLAGRRVDYINPEYIPPIYNSYSNKYEYPKSSEK